jgi:sterol desaturase/sphingolipid hydroxylase (fatty acid hydroxylase superfamily)
MNFLRYVLISGAAFIVFYVIFKNKWAYAKIQTKFPKSKDLLREIGYSLVTVIIFAGIGVVGLVSPLRNYHLGYENIQDYGWLYWWLSIILMIFLHDTYFYWSHRIMHHPRIFKYFHLVHHKSTNPSPWTSYAFHPLEGIVEAGILFPIVFLIPFHISALISFLFFMMSFNVYAHLGYELFPKGFHKNFVGKWINTSVNHNLHHKYFTGNFGLYFLFWDRWMGTIREDYDKAYDKVLMQRSNKLNKNRVEKVQT